MIYLHQPITGFITKTSQLFSGRVKALFSCNYRLTEFYQQQMLPSATKQESTTVPARRNAIAQPSQILFR